MPVATVGSYSFALYAQSDVGRTFKCTYSIEFIGACNSRNSAYVGYKWDIITQQRISHGPLPGKVQLPSFKCSQSEAPPVFTLRLICVISTLRHVSTERLVSRGNYPMVSSDCWPFFGLISFSNCGFLSFRSATKPSKVLYLVILSRLIT